MRACTPKIAAELLGCSERTVRNMIERGDLEALTTTSPHLIVYRSLKRYLLPDREGMAEAIGKAVAKALAERQEGNR